MLTLLGGVSSDRGGCEQIVNAVKLDKANVQTGTTLMLYRAEEHKKLELDRSIKVKAPRSIDTKHYETIVTQFKNYEITTTTL